MKVYQHPEYDGRFPEVFPWGMIDSPKLEKIASDCASQIKAELKQPIGNRVNVAGLRFALSRIAGIAEL